MSKLGVKEPDGTPLKLISWFTQHIFKDMIEG